LKSWLPRSFPLRARKISSKIKNVAFLVEDEPSLQLRREERLGPHMTLLGHYRGVPHTVRGDYYGMGNTLPDTITLFQIPLEELAQHHTAERVHEFSAENSLNPRADALRSPSPQYVAALRRVIRETIWHEVAHHFGMNEHEVREREAKRKV
jgi:predicted Zn-dependent protease with MMP-like domain